MNRLRQSFRIPSPRTGLTSLLRSSALPPALLLLALSSAFVFGNDRDSFYYRVGHHPHITSQSLTLAANLSPDHNFLMFIRQTLDTDGELAYEPYNRFPIGTYLLVKLAILPFEGDFSAQILAARLLTLAFFAAAALLAYLALRRLTSSSWIALAATLLTFSSFYWLHYNDMVATEFISVIGVMVTFHGMVVFAQEGRFRQLLFKTCIALLLGWYVYALLLPFIILGLGGELIGALRAHMSIPLIDQVKRASLTLLRSRYLLLGIAALLFGLATLGLNFASEYYALKGETPLTELPSFQSMLNRSGQSEEFSSQHAETVAWNNYLPRQIYRIGEMMIPYGVPGYDITGWGGLVGGGGIKDILLSSALRHWIGIAACAACVVGLIYTRHKHLFATIVLAGFFWAIPMRHNTAFHEFETLNYTGIPLFLFALALLGARRLFGERPVGALAVGAAALFAVSAFQMSDVGNVFGLDEVYKEAMADFETIRPLVERKTVFVHQYPNRWMFSGAYRSTHYYLTGSVILFIHESDRRSLADLVVTRERKQGEALLTPNNRHIFLYDRAAYDAQRLSELRESAADAMRRATPVRADFDLRLHDGRLIYAKEGCGRDDAAHRFFLRVTPRNVRDLPPERRQHGIDSLDFWFWEHGASSDGQCLAIAPLPEYEIDSIRTGQFAADGGAIWSAVASEEIVRYLSGLVHIHGSIVAQGYGDPVAESAFRIYHRDNALVYHKLECAATDIEPKFLLHIFPQNAADLPSVRQEFGFDNLDFHFADYGANLVDGCVALVPLPEYAIDSIRTGQFGDGESVWRVEFAAPQ